MDSIAESCEADTYAFEQRDRFNRPNIFQPSDEKPYFLRDESDHSDRDVYLVDTVDALNFTTEAMQSKKRSSGSLELPEACLESEISVDETSPRFDVTTSYNPYSLSSSCDGGNSCR